MPQAMGGVLQCWHLRPISFRNRVQNVAPLCLMCQIRNRRAFEELELNIKRLKSQFVGSLFFWMSLDGS